MSTLSDQDGRSSWSAPAGAVVALWVLALAAAGWLTTLVVSGGDPAGQLIAGLAALGLALAAASGTRARPRLEAGPDGLTVRRLTWTRHAPWARVDDVRVLRTRRFGRESALLELDLRDVDGGERLVILGRPELGADPEDVAEALAALRPPRP
ncbi:PH domain-containing protein [Pseudonocardia sp. C8]|uniref:PH domain-containing protein n=1 Tax=Pseudonocardia sp. C8 TaxID=2762759 RepID=UPI00164291B3|nr:PH domain-containing protein [Pseudonocardia sp. C8]MBC3194458.1 PH domain-containing protein [Pseudonocardia sp. C8]